MWRVVAYIKLKGASSHAVKKSVVVEESNCGQSTRRGCSHSRFRMITSKATANYWGALPFSKFKFWVKGEGKDKVLSSTGYEDPEWGVEV
jgi:hypothetical protein